MEANLEQTLANATIGEPLAFQINDKGENIKVSQALAERARMTIDIVSPDLDKPVLDTVEFYEAIKTLPTGNRKARIRILITDSEKIIKNGHRLLDLARRLPSFIEIKVQGKSFKDFCEAWLITDAKAWLRRPHADRYEAEVDFSSARKLRDILKDFEAMWNEAIHDPNLRRLSL